MNPMEGIDDRIIIEQKYLDMSMEELEKLYEELKSRPNNLKVREIEVLDDLNMVVIFSTGERRLFDATCMLEYPAFKILESEDVFKTAKVEYGVVTWNNGDIDLAPETMYEKSYAYESLFGGAKG